jgi:serine/threonine-protein kinase
MAGCPDDETMAALSEGRLGERELLALHAHVDGCQSCQWLLSELAAVAQGEPESPSPMASASSVPVLFAPGALLGGRYRLERRLGNGGMGTVWAALHVGTDRQVALKVLRRDRGATSAERLRFLREARLLGRIDHPNLVPVRDVFEEGGVPILAMDLLRGEPLGERLRRQGRLPVGDVARLFVGALEALEAAHAAGVVHRDLKPDNLFVDGDGERLRVLDFGVAKLVTPDDATVPVLTAPGEVIGTPPYMAPEQLRADPTLDRRVDVWAVGVILYECLAGRRPFVAEKLSGYVEAICAGRRAPLAVAARGLPPDVVRLVERMLTVDREARPATLGEAIAVLRRHAGVASVGAAARRRSGARWAWGLTSVAAVAAIAGIAVVAGVGTARLRRDAPAPPPSPPTAHAAPSAPAPAQTAPAGAPATAPPAPTSASPCERAWPTVSAAICRAPLLALREAAWRVGAELRSDGADAARRAQLDAERAALATALAACRSDEACLLERLRDATARVHVIDCAHAVSRDAKAICHDAALASLAGALAAHHEAILAAYRAHHRRLPRNVPPPRAFSTEETASLLARHRCGDDTSCLARHLEQRLATLQSLHRAFLAAADPSGTAGRSR